MEGKLIVFILCDLLGLTGLGRSFFSTLDDPKEVLILMISALYILARAVIMVDKHLLFRREKILELKEREAKK